MKKKKPQSDNQFTTTVAYYYRFIASEAQRKEAITADDLQEACRQVGRDRFMYPGQTLRNTHRAGLIDKAERGAFRINAVGENLVAMTLPSGTSPSGLILNTKVKKTGNRKKTMPKVSGRKKGDSKRQKSK